MTRLTGFSPLVRKTVWDRAGGLCEKCGSGLPNGGQYHHRRPRGAGGSRREDTNTPANCLLLCGVMYGEGACHQWIEYHRTVSYEHGWLISQHRKNISPSEVPVHLHDGCFLLSDDGERYSVPCRHEEAA